MHRVELKVAGAGGGVATDTVFLMHRVELKECFISTLHRTYFSVPNAPCGVERPPLGGWRWVLKAFLMHRVELKAPGAFLPSSNRLMFLMHRVELKEISFQPLGYILQSS